MPFTAAGKKFFPALKQKGAFVGPNSTFTNENSL